MNTIVLRVTNECNLRCTYCYDNNNHDNSISRKIATDNFYKNKSFILEDAKKILGDSRSASIIFHGGEPLLVDVNLLDEFCTALRKEMRVNFSIQTNGTLIDQSIVEFFKKHHVGVGISLDGSCPEQNSARIFKNGTNSFNAVMKKINFLQQENVNFGVVMSIGKLHIGCEQQLYDFLANNKIKCNIRPVFPTKDGDNSMVMTVDEYVTFFNNLFDIWFNDPDKKVTTYQVNEFAKELSKIIVLDYKDRMCECSGNCFNNFISLDVFGEIYSCNRLYNVDEFHYGNIRQLSMEEVYFITNELMKKRLEEISKTCKGCSIYSECYGGCPAEAYSVNGTIYSTSWNCEIKNRIREHIKQKVYSK